MTEAPAMPAHDAEHPSTPNGRVSDAPATPTVTGHSATEIASQEAFLVGLDLLVQRLANDAAELYRTGHIDKDAFHELITNYTGLRSDIRFRRRDLAKHDRQS